MKMWVLVLLIMVLIAPTIYAKQGHLKLLAVKDIACSYLDKDCLKYDFIYTIKAGSPIIAGPSAGGAITLLTISLLEGFELDEGISITGTINSGGIIGSVGGIKEKIDA